MKAIIPGLSAVIITQNEALHIKRCLQSLTFCTERIVVDSGSTDATVALASPFARVVHQPWLGYGQQKNFANSLAKGPWILSLDADEEVSELLQNEIRNCLSASRDTVDAYDMPRLTFHMGKSVRHGGWYPDRAVRLFRKDKGQWTEPLVHERLYVSGRRGHLKNPLWHYSYQSTEDQVARLNHYSTLRALEMWKKGKNSSLGKIIWRPVVKWLEVYCFKLGFLDGKRGWVLAMTAAFSSFMQWVKLWELEQQRNHGTTPKKA